MSTPVTGSFSTAVSTFDLTDTIFQGTWDADTGALTGKFVFPTVTVSVTNPSAATISLVVEQPTEGTGSVDPVTNAATFDADLQLTLLTIDIGLGPFEITDCSYGMSISLAGDYDPETGLVDLASSGFGLSAVDAANPDRCYYIGLGQTIASIIDGAIVGTGNSFNTTFDLGIADAAPPPPPPPPPAPPAPAPSAPAPSVAGVQVKQLPRTGDENLVLVVVGLGLIGVGYLALSASQPARRRRATSAR